MSANLEIKGWTKERKEKGVVYIVQYAITK